MSMARYLIGDVFDALTTVPDGSVDLVITSPPFLALRSYLPADDPLKAKEIGSEATPAAFLDVMLAVTAELRRVLAEHGSIAIEFGDTYAGSGGGGGDYLENGWREGQQNFAGSAASMRESNAAHWRQKNQDKDAWPLAKSRALIPELYRVALAYGHNPLTGQPSPAGKWRIRNVVTWCRPNPPVGALGDKWRPATSDVVVACTSAKRYWDDLATREPHKSDPTKFTGNGYEKGRPEGFGIGTVSEPGNPAGAPLLDWWEITTGGYKGAHYAVFPPDLVVPLVKAMGPRRVCEECGEPSRRTKAHLGRRRFADPMPPEEFGKVLRAAMDADNVTVDDMADFLGVTPWMIRHYRGETATPQLPSVERWPAIRDRLCFSSSTLDALSLVDAEYETPDRGNREVPERLSGGPIAGDKPKVVTLGWSDCGHDNWRPGHVLDPFAGTGTTLAVATGHGLTATGIDIDHRNAELAAQRLGMFLEDTEEVPT